MKKAILLSVVILLICLGYSFADVPCKINYQGRLIEDNVPVDGTKTMKFSIYDSLEVGNELWTSGDIPVEVHNGLFRYVIGSDGGDLSSIDWTAGQELYLEVKVGTEVLTPREQIYAYPYAINSHLLEGCTIGHFLDISESTQTKKGGLNIEGNVGIGTTQPGAKLVVVLPHTPGAGAAAIIGSDECSATGDLAIAMGDRTTASGRNSIAMGYLTTASGVSSTAMGHQTTASGFASTAAGETVTAGARHSIVLGEGINDGNRLVNNIAHSLMVGFNSNIPTLFVGPSSGSGTTGNVGIGTTSPQAELDVDGSFRIGGGTVIKKVQLGYVGTGAAGSAGNSGTVTFDPPFSTLPLIFLTVQDQNDSGANIARVITRSITNFTWSSWAGGSRSAADRIFWIAVEVE